MNKVFNSLKNPTIFWNILGITLNAFYSLIIIVFIARIGDNGIEISGQFSFAFYISSVLSTIGNYGGRIYHVSDISNEYNDANYISLKYISSLLMIITAVLFVIFNHYNYEKIFLILIFTVYRIFESISDAYYGVMQKNNSLKNVGISMSIKAIGSIILFILLYIFTNNLLIASTSFIIIFSIIYICYDKKYCKKYDISKIEINNKTKQLLMKCFPIFLFTFLNLFILNISRYFVDLRFDDVVQGYYSILILPASLMSLFIQFLLQPLLKKLVDVYKYNGKIALKQLLNKIILYFIVGSIFILIITYFAGIPVLNFVYKVDLNSYKFLLATSVASGLLYGLVNIYSTALTIIRKTNIQVIIYIVAIFTITILSYILLKNSINNAIYMYSMTMVVLFILFNGIYVFFINKEEKE